MGRAWTPYPLSQPQGYTTDVMYIQEFLANVIKNMIVNFRELVIQDHVVISSPKRSHTSSTMPDFGLLYPTGTKCFTVFSLSM